MGLPGTFQKSFFPFFKDSNLDVLVFGHTHKPYNKRVNGILCFNPGSAGGSLQTQKPSIGLLNIENKDNISGDIVYL